MAGIRLKRTFLFSIIAGMIVMIVMVFLADYEETMTALRGMRLSLLPLLLLLSLGNYIFRFFKWSYFLRLLDIRLKLADSISVFTSGFAMSITPGKLGEVFKSVLLKQIVGAPLARTAPVVFAERYTDLGGLLLLASIGVCSRGYGGWAWVVGLALMGLFFAIITSRRIERLLLTILGRVKPLARFVEPATRVLDSARVLLHPKNLPPLLLLSAVAWFWECWALVFALEAFGVALGLADAVFIYSLATLAGALAFLPGGLGVTEGGLVVMLITKSVAKGPATAGTILVRLTTLWFAVILGILSLVWLDRRWHFGSRLWQGFQNVPDAEDRVDKS
ncbi:MAG: flippase-like domain-containing protein [bacterium]|nr:flippase-like domain-containing protein [bacterium]